MDIRKIRKIDRLIQIKQTGSPKKLARQVLCSERMIYKYLKYMREVLGAPISYHRHKQTYFYSKRGRLCLDGFREADNHHQAQ